MANRFRAWLLERAGFYRELPDYVRGLKKTAIQEILYGESVIAIAFAVYTYVYSISMAEVLIALAASFVLAGYHIWRADHLLLIPKITLRFENRDPFVQIDQGDSPEVMLKKYFRLFPECSTAVADCQGYLLAVFKEVKGRWEPTAFNEAVPLTWADDRTGAITIEPGIGPYLRIFYVDHF
jgi:hypothetical protein